MWLAWCVSCQWGLHRVSWSKMSIALACGAERFFLYLTEENNYSGQQILLAGLHLSTTYVRHTTACAYVLLQTSRCFWMMLGLESAFAEQLSQHVTYSAVCNIEQTINHQGVVPKITTSKHVCFTDAATQAFLFCPITLLSQQEQSLHEISAEQHNPTTTPAAQHYPYMETFEQNLISFIFATPRNLHGLTGAHQNIPASPYTCMSHWTFLPTTTNGNFDNTATFVG